MAAGEEGGSLALGKAQDVGRRLCFSGEIGEERTSSIDQ